MKLYNPTIAPEGEITRVTRLREGCCGMQIGMTYNAIREGSYVYVQLSSGEWTSPHWIGDANRGVVFFTFPGDANV